MFSASRIVTRTFARGMSTKSIATKNAPLPVAAYSQAIAANGFIYVSGQVPRTADNKNVDGDIKAKTKQCIENIKAILEAAGSSLEKTIKINIFLCDMNDFKEVNVVYAKYFESIKPARSCVAVKTLPAEADIEIEAVALE